MDLSFDITALGLVAIAAASVLYGLALAVVGDGGVGYEWLLTAIATFVGAFIGSEYLGLTSYAPIWEGIALVPAVLGGAVTGFVVALVTRYAGGGSLTHGPRPA